MRCSYAFSFHLSMHLLGLAKGLGARRLRVLASSLLITLIMIPLVVALMFMNGMMQGITEKFILLQDGHVQLYGASLDDTDLVQSLLASPTIVSADYVVDGYGIVYSKDTTKEVRIKGVSPSYFTPERLNQLSYTGTLLERTSNIASVMISTTLAQSLGVSVGDRIACMVVPDSSSIRARPLLATVSGLYNSGYHELDASLIFMNFEHAQTYFSYQTHGRLEVVVDSRYVDRLGEITQKFSENHTLMFATWDQFNRTVYQNFITSRQVILLVFFLILLVSGVYVASISQEMVQDSLSSIALFKTIGALNRQIMASYAFTVLIITCVGMIIGIAGGISISLHLGSFLQFLSQTGIPGFQYYLLHFPLVVSWKEIGLIVITMIFITLISVRISLRRIRTISPLELLQQD